MSGNRESPRSGISPAPRTTMWYSLLCALSAAGNGLEISWQDQSNLCCIAQEKPLQRNYDDGEDLVHKACKCRPLLFLGCENGPNVCTIGDPKIELLLEALVWRT